MKNKFSYNLFLASLAVVFLSGCGKPAADAPPAVAPAAEVNKTNQLASEACAKLAGKWQRPDGDYIIQIRSVESSGKMDATYFNPQPIHVAKAEASQQGEATHVFIELQDVNYPGSTYRLAYDPATDRLAGAYFQALERETFEVFFVRLKP